MISGLYILWAIHQAFELTHGSVTLALDGASALSQCFSTQPLYPHQQSYDLIVLARHLLSILPFTITSKWVEGHQRERGKRQDWWSRQNEHADSLAKQWWKSHHGSSLLHPTPLLLQPFSLSVHGESFPNVQRDSIYQLIYSQITKNYWHSKNIPVSHIDWTPGQHALKQLPNHLARFHAKFTTGHIASGRMMHRRDPSALDHCPRCAAPDETMHHILTCPAAQSTWTTFLSHLRFQLDQVRTDPAIADTIIAGLRAFQHSHPPPTSFTDPLISAALQGQQDIGWFNFIMGKWHPAWRQAQESYLTWTRSRRHKPMVGYFSHQKAHPSRMGPVAPSEQSTTCPTWPRCPSSPTTGLRSNPE